MLNRLFFIVFSLSLLFQFIVMDSLVELVVQEDTYAEAVVVKKEVEDVVGSN